MSDNSIIALHGFLGKPQDWDFLFGISAVDLFASPVHLSLEAWGRWLNQHMTADKQKKILMGYSLGGRLALHALIQSPSQWKGAIIISTHPGLETDEERYQRLKEDEKWAARFRSDSWPTLMHDWEGQAVFRSGALTFQRQESNYRREALALALENWSLGKQQNLRSAIQGLNIPILWIVGQKDVKYASLVKPSFFLHPLSKWVPLPSAGHRVPWEQPQLFKQIIDQFLYKVLT